MLFCKYAAGSQNGRRAPAELLIDRYNAPKAHFDLSFVDSDLSKHDLGNFIQLRTRSKDFKYYN